MVENISTAFRCNVCNKNYKDKTGLWYHNKKYHTDNKSFVSQNDLQNNELETFVSQESVSVSRINIQKNEDNHDGYSCEYCGTKYLHRQSKYKHQQKCKIKSIKEKNDNENKIIA